MTTSNNAISSTERARRSMYVYCSDSSFIARDARERKLLRPHCFFTASSRSEAIDTLRSIEDERFGAGNARTSGSACVRRVTKREYNATHCVLDYLPDYIEYVSMIRQ